MGRSHALSGAVGWVAATTTCTELARHVDGLHRLPTPGLYTIAVGAVVSAGTALLPDIDHKPATAANVLGPITRWIARLVGRFGAWAHRVTRTRYDGRDLDGHRTISHTGLFAVLAGLAVAAICAAGPIAVAAVLFLAAAGALRALLPARVRPLHLLAALGIAGVTTVIGLTAGDRWMWLAVPATFGVAAHLAGDAITVEGCPLLWPIRIRGRRWYPFGRFHGPRIRTGDSKDHRGERRMRWLLVGVGAVSAIAPLLI
jgi:membrane-bound metal-dependent hydrolase YbcI (DUF457 family)